MRYKSSVLTCDMCEEGCEVCDFLQDNLSVATMLRVIEVLDQKLASEEDCNRHYRQVLVEWAKERRDGTEA